MRRSVRGSLYFVLLLSRSHYAIISPVLVAPTLKLKRTQYRGPRLSLTSFSQCSPQGSLTRMSTCAYDKMAAKQDDSRKSLSNGISFDYKGVKAKYMASVLNHNEFNKRYYKHPFENSTYLRIMELVRNPTLTRSKKERIKAAKYFIDLDYLNGVKFPLLVHRHSLMKIISCEHSFDVVLRAHIQTGHGSKYKTSKSLPPDLV
jgi:hypothetical protein